jgi:PPOX class probable F420-dependent enzyme
VRDCPRAGGAGGSDAGELWYCVAAAGEAQSVVNRFAQHRRELLRRLWPGDEIPLATLATISRTGGPQLTEVWFLHDDGELKLSLNTSRAKTKNLIARPACSLFVLDLQNPYRYIDVRGRAHVEADDDYIVADKVGAKYGSDLREHDGPDDKRVVVTIEADSVFAVDMTG